MFVNKKTKFKRGYVSDADQFLQELENLPGSKSDSRLEESQKYAKIFAQRDNPQAAQSTELTWKEF